MPTLEAMSLISQFSSLSLSCRVLLCFVLSFSSVSGWARQEPPAILPVPVKANFSAQTFFLPSQVKGTYPPGFDSLWVQLAAGWTAFTGHNLSAATSNNRSFPISLVLDSAGVTQPEGYFLSIQPSGIRLVARDGAGLFYGWQSLLQLVQSKGGRLLLPVGEVIDYPRFPYRGVHLDVSRHMFPVAAIRKWIRLLAFYKINMFHWHLTDDQGWRIEIPQYPKLQSIAAWRSGTMIGHKKELPHQFDNKRYGGYYTQQEIQEVVSYAAQHQVTVIPEIEMPGHAQAALAAYPGLGCTGGPYETARFWGVFDDVFCAGNDSVFVFLQNVLKEVARLFPSQYIHIGGDECPKRRWKACSKCQQRIKAEGLRDEYELQSYFIRRIEKYVTTLGRSIIGWDEILEGGLAPNATVMSWRGEEGGITAASMQHPVIMTPEKMVYLDYYQSLYPGEQLAAGGYLSLHKIYNYDPLPASLPAEQQQYIRGVQANLWSEYLSSVSKAEYMMFPRVLALAETGWSQVKHKQYDSFLQRLRIQLSWLKKNRVYYAAVFDEIQDSVYVSMPGQVTIALRTDRRDASIRYTLNGKEPVFRNAVYTVPLVIEKETLVKAAVFDEKGNQVGRTWHKQFWPNKATGTLVKLSTGPAGNFSPSSTSVMVNGVTGTTRYNEGEWFGFAGENIEIVVDLGRIQPIHQVQTNLLRYHWQRMWEPDWLSIELSTDGNDFREVHRRQSFLLNGINPVKALFAESKVRYIRIRAKNKGVIPEESYGAGSKAWLLIDEISVY